MSKALETEPDICRLDPRNMWLAHALQVEGEKNAKNFHKILVTVSTGRGATVEGGQCA